MSPRKPQAQRRAEIAEAVLDLLATTPLAGLSTRGIAARVGVSQPALFRHFRSREALLLAGIRFARQELAGTAEEALGRESAGAQLRGLVDAVLTLAERRPGLPRLFGAQGATGTATVDAELAGLAGMVRGLVGEVVRAGQRAGEFGPSPSPDVAAAAVVAVLQFAARTPSEPVARQAVEWVVASLAAGSSTADRSDAPPPAPLPSPTLPSTPAIHPLDVRPALARGEEPFAIIRAAVDGLGSGGVLELQTPFRPGPLLALLRGEGHAVAHRELAPDHHVILVRKDGPEPVDLTDLEAPEPMEAALVAARNLGPGDVWVGRTPRPPQLLADRLTPDGLHVQLHAEPEGTGLVLIWRRP